MSNSPEEIQNIFEIVLNRYKENFKEDNIKIKTFYRQNELLLSIIDNSSDNDDDDNISFNELTAKKKKKKTQLFQYPHRDCFNNPIQSSLHKMLQEVNGIKNYDTKNEDENYQMYLISHPLMKMLNQKQYDIIRQKMKENLNKRFKDNTSYKNTIQITQLSINDNEMEEEEENNEDISVEYYDRNNSNDYSDDYDDQNDDDNDDYTITNN